MTDHICADCMISTATPPGILPSCGNHPEGLCADPHRARDLASATLFNWCLGAETTAQVIVFLSDYRDACCPAAGYARSLCYAAYRDLTPVQEGTP